MSMTIKATIIEHAQGSEAWLQHRAKSLNASDLAAAMGMSKYMTRAELIARIATGIVPEVDAATQRRFDKGHEVEAAARPLAEEIIGDSLYPVVLAADIEGLHVSASLDGQDLLGDVTWEHKLSGAELIASLEAGVIPEQYHPQMEQGLMLSGAKRCLFMASNGTRESMRCCWYESNPELRAKIIPTWKQLMADVAAYVPTAAEVMKPIGRTPDQLPALQSSVEGALVLKSNIKEWEAAALEYIKGVREHELKTDEDFANASAAVQWCNTSKTTLEGVKASLMSSTGDVNTAVGTLSRIIDELDKTRIEFTKSIKARNDERKGEIVAEGVARFADYIRELNASMPANYMPVVPTDFGGCIKNLRSFASIQNAVDSELARAKIAASDIANRIRTNIGQIDAANAPMLFADISTLVLKAPDDLAAVIAQRVAAEAQRKEAERERIRAEEAARLEREAAARAAAEKAEADRVERERAHAAQVEADRIAREQQEAVQAQRIRDDVIACARSPLTAEEADTSRGMTGSNPLTPQQCANRILSAVLPEAKQTDDGARMTLGEINARIAPVSITVAGLSLLGYEPVAVEKAARLYPASKFKAICQAISAHVLAATVKEAA